MIPPQQATARLSEKTVYNDKYVEFVFEMVTPTELQFEAGQYVSIKVTDIGERRSYSISSSPDVRHSFELLLDVEPRGKGVTYLSNLQFGQEISMLAPLGQFVLKKNTAPVVPAVAQPIQPSSDGVVPIAQPAQPVVLVEDSIVLVGSGSGVTPLKAMLLELLQVQHDPRPVTLHWGLRHEHYLFWLDEFEDLMRTFPNFSFQPVISQPTPEWPLSRGRVTDVLGAINLAANAGYYICGNDRMIKDTRDLLLARGVPDTFIHHEKFY